MVVNSAMDTKSLSRVEHVERVDLWKKVEKLAGWSAAEMPWFDPTRTFGATARRKMIYYVS